MTTNYIFVTGGVVSSLGKGIAAAALAAATAGPPYARSCSRAAEAAFIGDSLGAEGTMADGMKFGGLSSFTMPDVLVLRSRIFAISLSSFSASPNLHQVLRRSRTLLLTRTVAILCTRVVVTVRTLRFPTQE